MAMMYKSVCMSPTTSLHYTRMGRGYLKDWIQLVSHRLRNIIIVKTYLSRQSNRDLGTGLNCQEDMAPLETGWWIVQSLPAEHVDQARK